VGVQSEVSLLTKAADLNIIRFNAWLSLLKIVSSIFNTDCRNQWIKSIKQKHFCPKIPKQGHKKQTLWIGIDETHYKFITMILPHLAHWVCLCHNMAYIWKNILIVYSPSGGLYYKTFTAVIYGFSLQARVFVPGKPCLMFVGEAGAYPSETPFGGSALG